MVVLPTGAGKTVVAMMAMEALGARTLVVVPTIELLEQWRAALVERLGLPAEAVGVIGGGRHDQRPVTVITYQSAQASGVCRRLWPGRFRRGASPARCQLSAHPAPGGRPVSAWPERHHGAGRWQGR